VGNIDVFLQTVVMGNLMDTVLNSIDEICDLEFVLYKQTSKAHHYFYLNEQSSIQVLRLFPANTAVDVIEVFSQRHRIAMKVDTIQAAKTIAELFNIVLPLVENGNFPCDRFTLLLNNETRLECNHDGEVHLSSGNTTFLHDLLLRLFVSQQYDSKLLLQIIGKPNLYHRLERPNKIIASYKTFDEMVGAI